jgi:NitT/TauT family transport system ATP-binding protein
MGLTLRGVGKKFEDRWVLQDISMEIGEGRLICILGPSGCGKTTLLNLMAGLYRPDRGELEGFSGRRLSYIFQEPRLIKWLTVRGNVEFVLKEVMSRERRREAVERYLSMVGLAPFQDYYPDRLSGGMRQRVAIARAFAHPSDLLLMDEAFHSLDLDLKLSLIDAFKELWLQDNRTTVFVTHDIQEAVLLGDEIYIMTQCPASIRRRLTVGVARAERSLYHDGVIALERELYGLLTGHRPHDECRRA